MDLGGPAYVFCLNPLCSHYTHLNLTLILFRFVSYVFLFRTRPLTLLVFCFLRLDMSSTLSHSLEFLLFYFRSLLSIIIYSIAPWR